MKKTISIVMTLCIALSLCLGAAAAPLYNEITAQIRPDYTIDIDDAVRTFYNVNGQQVYPVLYDGTTYLPVRAIAEIMGKLVNWDEASLTVTLYGERTEKPTRGQEGDGYVRNVYAELRRDFTIIIDGEERSFYDVNGKRVYPVLFNGSTYLPVRAIGEIMGKTVAWDAGKKLVTLSGDSKGTVTDADTFGPTTPTDPENYITLDKAKSIALAQSWLNEKEVTFVYAKLDYQLGAWVYEVEFYQNSNRQEYDFVIDAGDGSIVSYDYDAEHYAPSTEPEGQYLTLDEAKAAALKDAGFKASQVTFAFAKLDYDSYGWNYKVCFYKDAQEYYYVLDAKTGSILFKEIPQSDQYITLDEAKAIALKDAGLKKSQVTFVCAKLDYSNKCWEYEIEFYCGDKEYDYRINAANGAIVHLDEDAENYTPPSKDKVIGLDAVKKLIFEKIPGAEGKHIRKIELDYENGRLVYEGEVKYRGLEYEFEIDAFIGEILDWDIDD